MLKFMKKIGVSYLFTALISLVLGVIYIVWPEPTQTVFCLIVGSALVVFGLGLFIYHLASKKNKEYLMNEMIIGLITVVVGALFIFKPNTLFSILSIALGIVVFAHGLINIQESFLLKKCGNKKWYIFFLISLAFSALGLVILFVPGIEGVLLAYMLGISLALAGVFEIVVFFIIRKYVKDLEEDEEAVVFEEENRLDEKK